MTPRTFAALPRAAPSACVLLVACGAAADGDAVEPRAATSLADTSWRLVGFASMDDVIGTTTPADPNRYTLQLNADGSAALQLDCNRGLGTWTAQAAGAGRSGRFAFGPLATTRARCPPPGLGERRAADMTHVRGYLLRDGRLHLSFAVDAGIYTWEPLNPPTVAATVPAAAEDGGPRCFRIAADATTAVLREAPAADTATLAVLAPGTVLDNLGCRLTGDVAWCDVQFFGGGARGYVEVVHLEGAPGPDGTVPSGYDDSAQRAGQGRFDATGERPCALAAGQPLGACAFGVARAGGGDATVAVTRPDGFTRPTFFRRGRGSGADTGQADGYAAVGAVREGGLNRVQIGAERYEIADAVVLGD